MDRRKEEQTGGEPRGSARHSRERRATLEIVSGGCWWQPVVCYKEGNEMRVKAGPHRSFASPFMNFLKPSPPLKLSCSNSATLLSPSIISSCPGACAPLKYSTASPTKE